MYKALSTCQLPFTGPETRAASTSGPLLMYKALSTCQLPFT